MEVDMVADKVTDMVANMVAAEKKKKKKGMQKRRRRKLACKKKDKKGACKKKNLFNPREKWKRYFLISFLEFPITTLAGHCKGSWNVKLWRLIKTNVSQKPVEGNFALTSNERTNSTPSSPLSFRFLECGSFRRKGRRIQSQRNYIVKDIQCLGLIIQETLRIVREAVEKKGTLGRSIFPHMQVFIFSFVTRTL